MINLEYQREILKSFDFVVQCIFTRAYLELRHSLSLGTKRNERERKRERERDGDSGVQGEGRWSKKLWKEE